MLSRRKLGALVMGLPLLRRRRGGRTQPRDLRKGYPEHWFWNLWHENEAGEKWHVPVALGHPDYKRPEGFDLAFVCFPSQLDESVYRCRPDGGYGSVDRIIQGSRGWSAPLVDAMVRHGFTSPDAISIAARSCERCMNVLLHTYTGDDGYSHGSPEWHRAGTSCDHCAVESGEGE